MSTIYLYTVAMFVSSQRQGRSLTKDHVCGTNRTLRYINASLALYTPPPTPQAPSLPRVYDDWTPLIVPMFVNLLTSHPPPFGAPVITEPDALRHSRLDRSRQKLTYQSQRGNGVGPEPFVCQHSDVPSPKHKQLLPTPQSFCVKSYIIFGNFGGWMGARLY